MIAYLTIVVAISITANPTLIAMLRSTEILISLITESFWWNKPPDMLTLCGSLLVAICVASMASKDWLYSNFSKIQKTWCKKEELLRV